MRCRWRPRLQPANCGGIVGQQLDGRRNGTIALQLGIDMLSNIVPERVATSGKTLRIGIASRDQLRARTIAVARGEIKPRPDDPKVWFASLESLARVLSSKNQLLLEIIKRARPASITELAKLSGRQRSNLTRTLRTMERYQFVAMNRSTNGKKAPSVPYQRVSCEFELFSAQIRTRLQQIVHG
jgi:predicted transcriptional regulator